MVWPPLLIRLAMTASGTARILAVSLLVLSVAPWASIYAVMMSLHAHTTPFTSPDQHDEEPSLASVLQNQNVTLEELYMALFHKNVEFSFILPNANTHHSLGHWTVVLPWAISLLLGIVIPFLISLCSFVYGRDEFQLGPDEDPWISRHRKERRLSRLVVACEDYRKILTEEDKNDTITTDKEQAPKWKLPLPGSKVSDSTTTRCVEGTCAVCLGQYATGDEVIWSSNPKCYHVFHDDCILSWLLRRRKQCPCCRQSFLIKSKTD